MDGTGNIGLRHMNAARDHHGSDLLRRYGAGDPTAARELSALFAPRSYALALRVLGDRAEAEDIAQETMLRLWQAAPDWHEGGASLGTWVYRVALNLCIDRQRKSRRAVTGVDQVAEPVDPAPSAAATLQGKSRVQELRAALGQLPERQRQAMILRHLEELPNPEIAAIMEISIEAVESLTARGKRGLKKHLSGRQEELGYRDD